MCDFLSVIFYVNIRFDVLGSTPRESILLTGFYDIIYLKDVIEIK